MEFNFMRQAAIVENLLMAGVAALPHLPQIERDRLATALRDFETFGVPTLWSAADVNDGLGLTAGEKAGAIAAFISNYACTEADWAAIEEAARQELQARERFIKMEYDPLYTGGEYAGDAPKTTLVPWKTFEDAQKSLAAMGESDPHGEDAFDLAFRKHTGLDSMHIVACAESDVYNGYGELIGTLAPRAN